MLLLTTRLVCFQSRSLTIPSSAFAFPCVSCWLVACVLDTARKRAGGCLRAHHPQLVRLRSLNVLQGECTRSDNLLLDRWSYLCFHNKYSLGFSLNHDEIIQKELLVSLQFVSRACIPSYIIKFDSNLSSEPPDTSWDAQYWPLIKKLNWLDALNTV